MGGVITIKKDISLNKLVSMAMIAAYGIILILLTCMDCYLIGNYQKTRRAEKEELLADYVNGVSDDIKEINTELFYTYAYDNHYNALDVTLTELEEYNNIYELDYVLKNRVILEEKMHGYIIYYSANKNVRYYMDTEIVEAEDMAQIKEVVKSQIEGGASNWNWFFVEIDGRKYGLVIGKKKNVSLCMIYSLKQVEQNLTLDAGAGGEVFFMDNGIILGDVQKDKYQNLQKQMGIHENSFQCYFKGKYVYGQRVENTSLWICMAVPVTLWSYMNMPQLLLVLLTVSSALGAYLLYRYIRKELILPLRELSAVMNRIRDGEWDATMERGVRFAEIRKVNEALGVMVSEIKKQKMFSYEQTIEKQKAQMQYLQLQLKPHFYLNGLKTLNVLALNGDGEKMQDLIMRLSYHLRYLLQAEKEFVLLTAEIDYVKNYIKLQEDMIGRTFSIVWNEQENMADWEVPTLCIHTFIENSFKYAKLGSVQKELIIQIRINELETEEGKFLDIQIRDNGAGYPENILREINAEPVEGSVSVGINNLKRRCRLLYGTWAEYDFYNEDGAVSELVLPWNGGER